MCDGVEDCPHGDDELPSLCSKYRQWFYVVPLRLSQSSVGYIESHSVPHEHVCHISQWKNIILRLFTSINVKISKVEQIAQGRYSHRGKTTKIILGLNSYDICTGAIT